MPREKDPLTKLFTNAYIKDDLPDELNRAKRFGRELGLMLLEPKIPEALRSISNINVKHASTAVLFIALPSRGSDGRNRIAPE